MEFKDKFYENLQTHRSVDLGNRIIIFLLKRYIDHFFSRLNFSTACKDQCNCTSDPSPWWSGVMVSCERKNLTSIPMQFPLNTTTL